MLSNQTGAVNGLVVTIIGLSVLFVGMSAFAIWAFINYDDYKTNVDSKVSIAVAEAKKEQAEADEVKFAEREKEPNRLFVGPDDYGRLTFSYPKTWSAYVAKDTSKGGSFEAYLHRDVVPPVSNQQQYMLRVLIEDTDYDQVVKQYESLVKKGDLRTSTSSSDGNTGTRLDGNFTKDVRGAAVIYKVRDKTVTLRTDADQFKPDFEQIIETIKFNQ